MIIILLILILVAIVIGVVIMNSNQISGLKKMNELQRSLDDINQKLREMKGSRL